MVGAARLLKFPAFSSRVWALVPERLNRHRTAAASVLAMAIKAVGALLTLAIFTAAGRAMSADDFGRLAVWFNAVSLFAVAAVCGQDTLIMRSWGEYAGRGEIGTARAAYRFGWQVTAVAGLVFAALFFVGARWLDPQAQSVAVLACALFLFAQTLLHYSSHSSRVIVGFVVSETNRELTWRVAAFGAVLYGVWRGGVTPSQFFFAGVAGMALSLFFQLVAVYRRFKREASPERPADVWGWLAKARSMWISAIVEAVSQYADVVLVAYFASASEAGAYFAAARFANVFMMVTTGLHTYSLTHSASLFFSNQLERLQAILRSLAVVSLVFMLPLVIFVIVAGSWLLALFGSAFAAAYPVLVVLTLASFVRSLCGPAPGILLTTGHERLYSGLVTLATFLRLAITAVLATRYGALGAAAGWALGTAPYAIALAAICYRVCGVDPSIASVLPRMAKFAAASPPQGRDATAKG